MLAVNPSTQMLLQYLDYCRDNNGDVFTDPAAHPYFISLVCAEATGVDPTDEEYKERTVRLLAQWAQAFCGRMLDVTLKEITDCGEFAEKNRHRKAKKMANELHDSMPVIVGIFKSWAASIDYEHIGEWLWEDGVRRQAAGTAPDISTSFVETGMKKVDALLELIQKKLETATGSYSQTEKKTKEAPKAAEPKAVRPPVTPADIMKLLFDSAKNPSVN